MLISKISNFDFWELRSLLWLQAKSSIKNGLHQDIGQSKYYSLEVIKVSQTAQKNALWSKRSLLVVHKGYGTPREIKSYVTFNFLKSDFQVRLTCSYVILLHNMSNKFICHFLYIWTGIKVYQQYTQRIIRPVLGHMFDQ
jgi:hypothetical protein